MDNLRIEMVESSEHLVNWAFSDMKITEICCVSVLCPRRRAFGNVTHTALGPAAVSDYAIVFVDTDAGITGLGEIDSVFKRRARCSSATSKWRWRRR